MKDKMYVAAKIDLDLKAALEQAAESQHRSVGNLLTLLIIEYLVKAGLYDIKQ